MTDRSGRVHRRGLLVLGGALLAGCAADPELVPGAGSPRASGSARPVPPRRPGRTRTPSPAPTVGVPDVLPAPTPWTPSAAEVEPQAKLAATRVVEALGTSSEGGPGPARRLRDVGADPGLAAAAGPLVPPGAAAVTRVVYPQYGGLTDREASVMAVLEQTWTTSPGDPGGAAAGDPAQPGAPGLSRRTVTVDVRLARTVGGWVVTELRPVPVGDLSTWGGAGRAALTGRAGVLAALPGVDLPDASVQELAAGGVDPLVVETLIRLAGEFSFAVTVFSVGHPANVFGTGSLSNHGRGRAVDLWAIDDRPVVELSTDSPLLRRFLQAAAVGGSDEIGGPLVPPGAGPGYFTNALHRDHVHIGFDV